MGMIDKNGLKFDSELHDFIVNEAIPGTGVDADAFFKSFAAIVTELAPKNRALLEKRDAFQAKLDDWYRKNGAPSDMAAYEAYLREIGYILPEGPEFQVATENVDSEIAEVAGPQLVVPVSNARYALNAANARWGSLYDALYGTDAMDRSADWQGIRHRSRRACGFLGEILPRQEPATRRWQLGGAHGLRVRGWRAHRNAETAALACRSAQLLASSARARRPIVCISPRNNLF